MAGKGHRRKQASQSSLQSKPSTSDTKTELIKEIVTSAVFRNCLADMIMHVIESIQKKIEDLTAEFADMTESLLSQQNSIKELQSIADELKPMPEQSPPDKTDTDTLLLRIHGLETTESSDICDTFSQLVKDKLYIPCLPSQFSVVTRESKSQPDTREDPSTSSEVKPPVITLNISSQDLYDSIYRARTLLKGTSIYLTEVLSKSEQYLFYLTRNAKRANRIAATWTYKSQIYVRSLENTIKLIKCPSELAIF